MYIHLFERARNCKGGAQAQTSDIPKPLSSQYESRIRLLLCLSKAVSLQDPQKCPVHVVYCNSHLLLHN